MRGIPQGYDSEESTQESSNKQETTANEASRLRWGVILLGLILVILNARWIAEIESLQGYTWPSMFSLPLNVIAVLFIITLLNKVIRYFARPWALGQAELLVIYSMLAVGSVIAGWSFIPLVLSWSLAPAVRATPENRYGEIFLHLLPDWLVPRDEFAIASLMAGETSFWQKAILDVWAAPLLVWTVFLLCFIGAMTCVSVIARQRWVDQERLTFPVVRLPFELTRAESSLLSNRWLWIGFSLSAGSALLSGLNRFYPAIPSMPTPMFWLGESFPDPPWRVMAEYGMGLPIRYYTWVVGFGMLMPQEVLFSYWFFYWFIQLQRALVSALGWQITPEFPYIRNQVGGAMLALLPAIIWSSRNYLRGVWRKAWRRPGGIDDSAEPISYRTAMFGIIVCVSIMLAILSFAGMSLWLGLLVLSIYFAFTIAITRARAEIGGPANEVGVLNHDMMLTGAFGVGAFKPRDLALLSLTSWWGTAYGQDPIPHQIEGLKLAQLTHFKMRKMLIALLLAALVGTPAAFLMILSPLYQIGVDTAGCNFGAWISMASSMSYVRLADWLSVGTAPDPESSYQIFALGAGFLFSLGLYSLRAHIFWWPFHPLGFVMAGNYYTNYFWPSIFIAWLIKSLLFRYGGQRAYTKSLPLFLGAILGDALMGSVWSIIGIFHRTSVFSVWL